MLFRSPEASVVEELHLYPEPGPAGGVERLQDFGFCVWCAHMVKRPAGERL